MTKILASKVSEQHALELLQLEKEELRKFQDIYQTARLEILGRLMEIDRGKMETQHLRYVLLQVQVGLDAMEKRLSSNWSGVYSFVASSSVEQTIEQIQHWDKKWKGRAVSRVRTKSLRQLLNQKELLATQYDSYVKEFRHSLEAQIRRRLSVHLVRNSPWHVMATDVAGRLQRHIVRGAQWRGERIVRTEMVNLVGQSDLVTLLNAGEDLPGLAGQWWAYWDHRTSDICKTLHGRVRVPGESYGSPAGYPIFHPPGHTWCRSRIIPWHPDWVEMEAA